MKTTSKKTEEVVVAEAKATEPVAEVAKQPVMYVGPTVPGLGIQNRVVTEIPASAQVFIEKTPVLGNLFIPIRDYPDAARQIREGRGPINSAFKKALEIKGGEIS